MLCGKMIEELSFYTHTIADVIARSTHTHADRRIVVLCSFTNTIGTFETF